jgi:hypothetical protein
MYHRGRETSTGKADGTAFRYRQSHDPHNTGRYATDLHAIRIEWDTVFPEDFLSGFTPSDHSGNNTLLQN